MAEMKTSEVLIAAQFTPTQLLAICRLADDAMTKCVFAAAKHIDRAARLGPWRRPAVAIIESPNVLDRLASDYADAGRLRQAAGSSDDTQHTRERFDAAVECQVVTWWMNK